MNCPAIIVKYCCMLLHLCGILMAMIDEYKSWLSDNSSVLEPLVALLPSLRAGARILVLGPYSLIPAMLLSEAVPLCRIEALCEEGEAKEDFTLNTDEEGRVVFTAAIEGPYDLIYGLFHLDSIPKSEAVPLLFDLKEALSPRGRCQLVIEDALSIVPGEGAMCEAWFAPHVSVFRKLYPLSDLIQTMSLIGFRIRAVEEVKAEGLSHVTALTLSL